MAMIMGTRASENDGEERGGNQGVIGQKPETLVDNSYFDPPAQYADSSRPTQSSALSVVVRV